MQTMAPGMTYLKVIISLCLWSAVVAVNPVASAEKQAELPESLLIVFHQPGPSPVEREFMEKQLPPIKEVAKSMGIAVRVVDAAKGAPKAVGITPLLVYQNHLGRSIYQGRTTTVDRVRNFLRTSRYVPQKEAPYVRGRTPVWRMGRSRVWAPLKVAPVSGTPPTGYDHSAFEAEALRAIAAGFTHFKMAETVALGRSDRGFYMDFYPWLSPDGQLYLSLALYSQFHCKAPIFELKKPPLIGPWSGRERLFRQAAEMLEAEVEKHASDPLGGDGFDPLPDSVTLLSWQEAGFTLPAARMAPQKRAAGLGPVPSRWQLTVIDDGPPAILFRFAEPLDQYRGEVFPTKGDLRWSSEKGLAAAQGAVSVDTASAVTMGEPMLDEAIKGALMLDVKRFPESRFDLTNLSSEDFQPAYGTLTLARIEGLFHLKGKTIPLTAPAEFELVVSPQGDPRLLVRTAFTIDLIQFDIEGADGPSPARHTVVFDINLAYRPAALPL